MDDENKSAPAGEECQAEASAQSVPAPFCRNPCQHRSTRQPLSR